MKGNDNRNFQFLATEVRMYCFIDDETKAKQAFCLSGMYVSSDLLMFPISGNVNSRVDSCNDFRKCFETCFSV